MPSLPRHSKGAIREGSRVGKGESFSNARNTREKGQKDRGREGAAIPPFTNSERRRRRWRREYCARTPPPPFLRARVLRVERWRAQQQPAAAAGLHSSSPGPRPRRRRRPQLEKESEFGSGTRCRLSSSINLHFLRLFYDYGL